MFDITERVSLSGQNDSKCIRHHINITDYITDVKNMSN